MKKLWKALGITALAAALIPYRVQKDEEAQTTSVDALLWQATRGPGEGEDKNQVDICIGFKSPLQAKREESALFADDEPEAAVVEAPLAEAAGEVIEKLADAAESAVEDVIAEAEAAENGFDPEA